MSTQRESIALCLSGGGLRATFFHLGVVRALFELGLLSRVKTICSVSGGSILAGHLVLNWNRYTGDVGDFDQAAAEVIRFGRIDLRGRIVRRWLLSLLFPPLRLLPPQFWERTALLQRYYDARLYHGASLRSLSAGDRTLPHLQILATSLTTGGLCSFTSQGFWTHDGRASRQIQAGVLPVSLAVAASSAFPPLFPPVRLARKTLDASASEMPYDPEYLCDGGVFDNLGVRMVHHLQRSDELDSDMVIVSDAGAGFDWQPARAFSSVVSRTARATDILMKRVGEFEKNDTQVLSESSVGPVVRCDIDESVARSDWPVAIDLDLQKRVRKIRTDLDVFSDEEVCNLIGHGQGVTYKAISATVTADMPPTLWIPDGLFTGKGVTALAKELESSRRRRIGLWNPRDWASWVGAGTAVLIPSVFAGSLILNAWFLTSPEVFTLNVIYATSRAQDVASVGEVTFSANEVGPTSFGIATVSIPRDHQFGHIEGPSWIQLRLDPRRHIAVLSNQRLREEEHRRLSTGLAQSGNAGALLFVHDRGRSFDDSLREAAVFAYDTAFDGRVMMFSWPTVPNPEESAEALLDALRRSDTTARDGQLALVCIGVGATICASALKTIANEVSLDRTIVREAVLVGLESSERVASHLRGTMGRGIQRITIYSHGAIAGNQGWDVVIAPNVRLTAFGMDSRVFSDVFQVLRGAPADARFGLRPLGEGTWAIAEK